MATALNRQMAKAPNGEIEARDASSRALAGLVGPSLLMLAVTEAMNMDIYAAQTAPVVYLNGTVLFVGGLALVRAHNRWVAGWPTLLTLLGWAALSLGLYRMAAPGAPQAGDGPATYVGLAILVGIGLILTWNGYWPKAAARNDGGA